MELRLAPDDFLVADDLSSRALPPHEEIFVIRVFLFISHIVKILKHEELGPSGVTTFDHIIKTD